MESITTISGSIRLFYLDQIRALIEAGFEVTIVGYDDVNIKNDVPAEVIESEKRIGRATSFEALIIIVFFESAFQSPLVR